MYHRATSLSSSWPYQGSVGMGEPTGCSTEQLLPFSLSSKTHACCQSQLGLIPHSCLHKASHPPAWQSFLHVTHKAAQQLTALEEQAGSELSSSNPFPQPALQYLKYLKSSCFLKALSTSDLYSGNPFPNGHQWGFGSWQLQYP